MAAAFEPGSMAFSKEESEWLARVGPGTLMGDLFRQYWIPIVPVSFLKEPGGVPRRVRLLGEDLVLFRTRRGEVGLVELEGRSAAGQLVGGRRARLRLCG